MATRTIAGKTVQVNDEGFMTNPGEWTKEIAVELAKEEGIAELTPAHWKVIEFCRQDARRERQGAHAAPHHHRRPASRPRRCSPCSPRGRPRRSPGFPAWASPKAASNRPE